MEYLLKSIACSFLLLVVYKLLLEREKMFVFNRFYLLFSLVASAVIPLITFQVSGTKASASTEKIDEFTGYYTNAMQAAPLTEPLDSGFEWDWRIGYGLVSLLLLIRFITSLATILSIKKNTLVSQDSVTIVLLEKEILPYSFLNYIFVHKEAYYARQIEPEIWQHELTHIRQKHSLDILFVELVRVFWWFNPCVYFYQKSIKMNHEFLADEAVLLAYPEVKNYQRLLVSKVSQRVSFTSAFNYAITKKRLLMMTKMTSRFHTSVRQLSVLPVLAIAIALFSSTEYAEAQTAPTMIRPDAGVTKTQLPVRKEGASDELLKEYQSIIDRCFVKKTNRFFPKHLTKAEEERLVTIFGQMSQQQRDKQDVIVMKLSPQKKESPTQKELDIWKNPKTSGVWIDGKRVPNAVLNKYKPEDFSYAMASKLYGKAKNPNYSYQIDLMTNACFEKYVKEREDHPLYMVRDKAWGKPNK